MQKKRIWLALITLLLACFLPAFAVAEDPTIIPMQGSVTFEGVVIKSCEYDSSSNSIEVVIDTEKTNWTDVVLKQFDGMNAYIDVPGSCAAPSGKENKHFYSGSIENLQNFQTKPDGLRQGDGQVSMEGIVGEYQSDKHLFFPCGFGLGRYVMYSDENGAYDPSTLYELNVNVSHTSYEPIALNMGEYPSANIISDATQALSVTAGDSIKVQNGKVSYVKANGTGDLTVTTSVTMPQLENDQTGWKMYEVTSNGETELQPIDGKYLFSVSVHGEGITERAISLCIRDQQGELKAAYTLSVSLSQGALKPWPAYADESYDVKAYAPDLEDIVLHSNVPGATAVYEPDGIFHYVMDGEKLINAVGADFASASAELKINPPSRATHVAVARTGDHIILGNLSQWDVGDFEPEESRRIPVAEVENFQEPFFFPLAYEGGDESYWRQANEWTGEYGGFVVLYYWYASEDAAEPELVEYFVWMQDEVAVEYQSDIQTDLDSVPDSDQKKPVLITHGGGHHGHHLHAHGYPTGKNRHYWELRVLDENGMPVGMKGSYQLRLPYPAGYGRDSNLIFRIRHYTETGETITEEFSKDRGNLVLHDDGVLITITSLSPFTLEWEPGTAAEPLPKTGDDTHVLFWLVLAVLSAAGAAVIWRRRKEA